MIIKLVVLCILLTSPCALWGVLCALNAMDVRRTRPGIAAGFLCCAIGWGGLIAAGVDYLLGDAPLFWPLMMLLGVLLLSIGNATIYLMNRRTCGCQYCSGRLPQVGIHPELHHG